MELTVSHEGPISVFSVSGVIDGSTAPQLLSQLLPRLPVGASCILDLSQVPFMSSAGLRTLLNVHRSVTAGNGRLILTGMIDDISDTMSATGFLTFFETAATAAEGLVRLRQS